MSVPPAPQRPDLQPPTTGRSILSIALAVMLFTVLAIIFVLLSNGMFAGVFAIGALIFGVTGMHYLLWGWWLGKMIRDEADEEELG